MKKVFTQWFLIFASTLTAAYFAHTKGIFDILFQNDISQISYLILGIFIGASILTGKLCWMLDKDHSIYHLKKYVKIIKFSTESMLSLGLIGTLIGLSFMMHHSMDATQGIESIVSQLKIGASTAFYTSLCGMLCSLVVNLQLLIINYNTQD